MRERHRRVAQCGELCDNPGHIAQTNAQARNFRLVAPDEAASNRLQEIFKATPRAWMDLPEALEWTWT